MALMSTDHVNAVKPFNGWPHPGTLLRQSGVPTTGTGVTRANWIGSSNSNFKGNALSAISSGRTNTSAGLKNAAQSVLGPAQLVARHAARPESFLTMVRKIRF